MLGILDKGTLTLGDNRKVDFSRAMIFMTSNLGAAEMSALVSPRLGFNACEAARQNVSGTTNQKLAEKIKRSGVEAARRKFTPEFISRLDKIVTFKPLGSDQLRRVPGVTSLTGSTLNSKWFSSASSTLQWSSLS